MQFSLTWLIFCHGARARLQRLSNSNKHHIFNAARENVEPRSNSIDGIKKIAFNLCPWLCRQNWILVNVPHTFPAGLPWHSIHVDATRSTYTNLRAHFQRALWFHTVLRGQKVERIVPHHELSESSWPRWHICQPCQKESTDLSFTLTFKWLPSRHGLSRQRFFVHVQASNCNQNNCLECAKSDDVGQHRRNVPQKLVFANLTQEPTPMVLNPSQSVQHLKYPI